MRLCLLLTSFIVLQCPVLAEFVTYNVDLSGLSREGFHTLRVFGTITLDADLVVDRSILGSELYVQHENDQPLSLPARPQYSGAVNTSLDWVTDGNDLYINRISDSPSRALMDWNGSTFSMARTFVLAAGTTDHHIFYSRPSHSHTTILKRDSGADGPFGFRVGSVSAVPEPGTAGVLALSCLASVGLRRRRRKRATANPRA